MILDKKKLRLFAFLLPVLICLVSVLMIMHSSGPRPVVPVPGARAAAERMLAEARAGSRIRETSPPSYVVRFATGGAGAEGARMLVRSDGFEGVAEEPQSIMAALAEMSGNKEPKVPPVRFTGSVLRKKVRLKSSGRSVKLNASAVLRPGESGAPGNMGRKSMIAAPVDYQLFKSSGTWNAFTRSHKGRFPEADFSREYMLILVSVSDLPSGIFKVADVKRTEQEVVVLYRVDPLAMAAGPGAKERGLYSATPVPKGPTVRLEQVP